MGEWDLSLREWVSASECDGRDPTDFVLDDMLDMELPN